MKLPLIAAFLIGGLTSAALFDQDDEKKDPPPRFEVFELAELEQQRAERKSAYLPFLQRPSMSLGIYKLAAGATDGQHPHGLDEVYQVISGKAKFTAGEETIDIEPGQVLFVAAHLEHRFHDIEEDVELLVFFSNGTPMKKPGKKD